MSIRWKAAVIVVATSMVMPATFSLAAENTPQARVPAAQHMAATGMMSQAMGAKHHGAMPRGRVMAMQEALNGHGAHLKADGVFGPKTRAALEHFQKQNGLNANGKVDQMTLAKLGMESAVPASPAPAGTSTK